jgi:hypothetical protein
MSNRLEHEFPAVRWQAMPGRGSDREVIRFAVERGRQLRSEAIRRNGRATFGALRGGLARAMAFLRCTALGLARRPDAGDCWARFARSA